MAIAACLPACCFNVRSPGMAVYGAADTFEVAQTVLSHPTLGEIRFSTDLTIDPPALSP